MQLPQAPAPFSKENLIASFHWYNHVMLADQTPPCGFGTYEMYYERLYAHFCGEPLNGIEVGSITQGALNWYGDKVKLPWILRPTIMIDNVHQTVWHGVFHLQAALESKEARAISDWEIDENEPWTDMDWWLYEHHTDATLNQIARYAQYGAAAEFNFYTSYLPGGYIASDLQQLSEGNIFVAAKFLSKFALTANIKLLCGPARKTLSRGTRMIWQTCRMTRLLRGRRNGIPASQEGPFDRIHWGPHCSTSWRKI